VNLDIAITGFAVAGLGNPGFAFGPTNTVFVNADFAGPELAMRDFGPVFPRLDCLSLDFMSSIAAHRRSIGQRILGTSREEETMEAKVDIRKLQLLNDRINQTIDALNQVRLSVHGLTHTAGTVPGVGYQMNPAFNNFGYGAFPGAFGGFAGGMSHTAGIPQQTWNLGPQNPFMQNLIGQNPFVQNPFVQNPFVQNPFVQNPYFAQGFGAQVPGISHTSSDGIDGNIARQLYAQALLQGQLQNQIQGQLQGGVDPYYAFRVAQTFPFAQWGQTPTV
jgi:hypothetical protein